ncbi:MAG: flagellar motor protein MotD [Gammaproteobacteria bacterium]|nr:flagellar motor protein MotD [Gammaproteobacteria bacterium]MBL4728819.1 flagellar motor protein MotD [Gammaproteobacteria bacterium]
MARKRKQAEPENHERWLVSYADFITLLFAFFVVMYSMSSVNEGKYRVLSDSMTAAFSQSNKSLSPIQTGEIVRSSSTVIEAIREIPDRVNISSPIVLLRGGPEIIVDPEYQNQEEIASQVITDQIDGIAADIETEFEEMIADNNVSVRKSPFWLEVVFNSNILFNSASADLSTGARVELGKLGQLLQEYENNVSVEGFTDNIPIISSIFPSNWELSSARAAAVVRLFEDYGVESARLISVGYGENRPVSENQTIEGRASNRRVVIVIMAKADQTGGRNRVGSDDSELFRRRIE